MRVFPADDGPPTRLSGLVFPGALAVEAVFLPDGPRTTVEYVVEIAMSIPVPGVLSLMPTLLLQRIGERAMEHKLAQMIGGFARNIGADFNAWLAG